MPNQKKRTAWSVQDVASGRAISGTKSSPRFKSGYSGPKKSSSAVMDRYVESSGAGRGRDNNRPRAYYQGGNDYDYNYGGRGGRGGRGYYGAGAGILDYAWIVYCLILGICIIISLAIYSKNANSVKGYSYPTYMFSVNGVVNRIYDDYKAGGLGYKYNNAVAEGNEVDKTSLLGTDIAESALPNTTMGATMTLDTGSTYKDYGIAMTYSELIEQLKKALEANDFGFVGMKLAYEDEETGALIGYPQSVVEHFTEYMSENSGKMEMFLDDISNENKYMMKNGSAYIVKLPILQFTINMGYDNTNVSVSGFSDRKMDSGQSAVVSPLLPCMYTITVTTNEGSQSSEVECDMGEGNLQVNIGVTN